MNCKFIHPLVGAVCRNQLTYATDGDESGRYNEHISQLIFAGIDIATGVTN